MTVSEPNGSALAAWRAEGVLRPELYERVRKHPRFGEAARTLARDMVALAGTDPTLDSMLKDAGRYLVAGWVVRLHMTGGLTLPSLKAVCIESRMLSPGRARALLMLLQALGFVAALPQRARGDVTQYAPTPALIQAWRSQLAVGLDAAGMIEPAIAWVRDRLDAPSVTETLVRIHGDALLSVASHEEIRVSTITEVFGHALGGMQILNVLVSSADNDGFPAGAPVAVAMAPLAKRLHIGRAQVARVLGRAEAAGLLARSADGRVALTDRGRAEIEYYYAHRLLSFLVISAQICELSPHLLN